MILPRKLRSSQKLGGLASGAVLIWGVLSGCSLFHERPIQLMSDTAAALRAAREVSADTLAPDAFRKANEAYLKAQNEYRLKNFAAAEEAAKKAKKLAEQAEYQAMLQGSSRTSLLPPEALTPPPAPSTYEPPQGELATEVMRKESQNIPNTGNSGGSAPSAGYPPSNFSP